MKRGLQRMLVLQGGFLALLLVFAFLARETPFTSALYAWSALIPVGVAAVFYGAYRRGVRVRDARTWTIEWERAEVKRTYRWLAVVLLAWMAGLVGVYYAFA